MLLLLLAKLKLTLFVEDQSLDIWEVCRAGKLSGVRLREEGLVIEELVNEEVSLILFIAVKKSKSSMAINLSIYFLKITSGQSLCKLR